MIEITIEDMKKREVDVLIEIDRICREYDIKYTLFGGTLIGAIRHGGFIPWDDDIDIAMPREHYEKFKSVFPKSSNSRYSFVDIDRKSDYYCAFGKVVDNETWIDSGLEKNRDYLGVFVDVFPLDYTTDVNSKIVKKAQTYASLLYMVGKNDLYYKSNKSVAKRIARKIVSILPCKFYVSKVVKNAMKDNDKNCNFMGSIVGGMGAKDIWPRNYFDEYIDVDFEGERFLVVSEYDKLLTHRFGNYMQLPPENEQVGHHMVKPYLKEE